MSDNKDTRNATQKIEDLERVVSMLYQSVGALDGAVKSLMGTQRDMVLVRDALRILNKKTEAIVQVAKPESGITEDTVSTLLTKMNVDDLKSQVSEYLKRGILVPTDSVEETSFLVCEEAQSDGKIVSPRTQFRLDSLDEKTKAALMGKKVGDTVSFGEDKFSAKILELYTLVDNPQAAPAETQNPGQDGQSSDSQTSDAAQVSVDAPATETPVQVAGAVPLPEETSNTFGLNFHGQPEAELTASATAEAPSQN